MKSKIAWVYLLLAGMIMGGFAPAKDFKTTQLTFERVKVAYEEKESAAKKLFSDKGLTINQSEIFLRVFKRENQLELWARAKGQNSTFQLLKTYTICSASGEVGPKRKMGDYQVPEGFYVVNRWNPQSNFYLSLGINYPNASDKILSDKANPGGDIFIHGNCVSIGCMAMTDPVIKEIYVAFVEAKNAGQAQVPVHIFPTKLIAKTTWDQVTESYKSNPQLTAFWKNLQPGYEYFETNHKLPKVTVNAKGEYVVQ